MAETNNDKKGAFSKYKSKKQSKSGIWEKDDDVPNCRKCDTKFGFRVRRHHCRMCGRIFCGNCCDNQIFLDQLTRSGKPKRVCDICFARERGLDPDQATEKVKKMDVSDSNQSTEDSKPTSSAPSLPGIPEIDTQTAVKALETTQFDGQWVFIFTFHVVDLRSSPNAVAAASTPAGAFKGASAAGGRRGRRPSNINETGPLRPGAKRRAILDLARKGGAYFKGMCKDLPPFGREGKVTGSMQRLSGQVSIQIQLKSAAGVTTSFNLVGKVNHDGIFLGTFSGCEIARSAGAVSGTFRAQSVAALQEDSGSESDSDSDEQESATSSNTEQQPSQSTTSVNASNEDTKKTSDAETKNSSDEETTAAPTTTTTNVETKNASDEETAAAATTPATDAETKKASDDSSNHEEQVTTDTSESAEASTATEQHTDTGEEQNDTSDTTTDATTGNNETTAETENDQEKKEA